MLGDCRVLLVKKDDVVSQDVRLTLANARGKVLLLGRLWSECPVDTTSSDVAAC